MRKTRLVILPTKCLHQMGFLLLFLSCPVIGDWGRIQPESENSHNAIRIDREGTCGLVRDPPEGLLNFLNETGSEQCRLSEDFDLNKPAEKSITGRSVSIRKSDERRVYFRRVNHWESERRMANENRDAKRQTQTAIRRYTRSRSVESGRSNHKNSLRIRSLSLSRLENEQTVRKQRLVRQYSEGNRNKKNERSGLTGQNERWVEQQRRLNREVSKERQKTEMRIATKSREKEIKSFIRSLEHERQDIQSPKNRENDIQSRNQERSENLRYRSDRRLSLARRELQDANKADRTENRRSTNRINIERRFPEIRKSRSLELVAREKSMRTTRNFDNSQDVKNKRLVSLIPKVSDRNNREQIRSNALLNERIESKDRRVNAVLERQNSYARELKLENEKTEEKHLREVSEWMDFKSDEGYKTGDWATNCVIGAVVYFLTTRQIKAA